MFEKLASTVLIIVAVATTALAQFDTNGPNATLLVQNQSAGVVDPAAHDMVVSTPGILSLVHDSGANLVAGILLLSSNVNPTNGNALSTPWGGSIDLGAFPIQATVGVIADGIALSQNPTLDAFFRTAPGLLGAPPSRMTLNLSVGSLFCGSRVAVQSVLSDPSAPPFFLDNTEAADLNFRDGQVLTLLSNGAPAAIVPFLPNRSFAFHGVNYTAVTVSQFGYITFGGLSTVAAGGFTVDAVSFLNANPAIAACMSDWAVGVTGPSDGILYEEFGDPSNGGFTARISWGDPRALPSGAAGIPHFADADFNNRFEIILRGDDIVVPGGCATASTQNGAFELNYPAFDAGTVTRPGDGILGHTPGGPALIGPQSSRDLQGSLAITGAGVAEIEEHNNTGLNASVIGWNGAGAARAYNEFRNLQGNSIAFIPAVAPVTGALGYISIPSFAPADDVQTVPQINVGGAPFTIIGKFFGFGAGTVTLVDSAGATIPLTVSGVVSGTGPIFTNEGLTVFSPAVATTGPGQLTVTFASGYSETLPVTVLSTCQSLATFQLTDDGFANVPLQNPVTHFGQTYNSIFVCANGTVNMIAGHGDFTPTIGEFFAGNGAVGNGNVAAAFADLNRGGTASGSIFQVMEDTCTGAVSVDFLFQTWWASNSAAGSFSVTFNDGGILDQVAFDYSGAINDIGPGAPVVVGFGDGFTATPDVDLATLGGIENVIVGYAATQPQSSVAETLLSTTIATRLGGVNGNGRFRIRNQAGITIGF